MATGMSDYHGVRFMPPPQPPLHSTACTHHDASKNADVAATIS